MYYIDTKSPAKDPAVSSELNPLLVSERTNQLLSSLSLWQSLDCLGDTAVRQPKRNNLTGWLSRR